MWTAYLVYEDDNGVHFTIHGMRDANEDEVRRLKISCDRWLSRQIVHPEIKSVYRTGSSPQIEEKEVDTGFIYLMKNLRNRHVKIGYSQDPKHRETTLQSQEPEIELIHFWPGNLKKERLLHEKYKDRRLRGEWFKLSTRDVRAIIKANP